MLKLNIKIVSAWWYLSTSSTSSWFIFSQITDYLCKDTLIYRAFEIGSRLFKNLFSFLQSKENSGKKWNMTKMNHHVPCNYFAILINSTLTLKHCVKNTIGRAALTDPPTWFSSKGWITCICKVLKTSKAIKYIWANRCHSKCISRKNRVQLQSHDPLAWSQVGRCVINKCNSSNDCLQNTHWFGNNPIPELVLSSNAIGPSEPSQLLLANSQFLRWDVNEGNFL